MKKNLLDKIDELQKQGIRITIDWINQIENGNSKQVESGIIPLWTCTAYAWETVDGIEDMIAGVSADTISEALEKILEMLKE